MSCQNPFDFPPDADVRNMPKVPGQQELALCNSRRCDMHRIDFGSRWDRSGRNEKLRHLYYGEQP